MLLEISRGLKRHLESQEWQENVGAPYAFRWLRDRPWTEKAKRPAVPAATGMRPTSRPTASKCGRPRRVRGAWPTASSGCNRWRPSSSTRSGARKQYPDAAYQALNNSLRRHVGTLNCGHAAFPVILGVNRPQYTPQELEQFRANNEKGVNVEGRHYTGYQATQMQRRLE